MRNVSQECYYKLHFLVKYSLENVFCSGLFFLQTHFLIGCIHGQHENSHEMFLSLNVRIFRLKIDKEQTSESCVRAQHSICEMGNHIG